MGMSVTIGRADEADGEQILKLQYLCYQSEAELYGDYLIDPLTETREELRAAMSGGLVLVARLGDEIVGSVRGRVEADGTVAIGRLVVHPRLRRHGLGARLLSTAEEELAAAPEARRYRLFTGHRSEGNLNLYRKLGYRTVGTEQVSARLRLVTLEKPVPGSAAPAAASLAVTS